MANNSTLEIGKDSNVSVGQSLIEKIGQIRTSIAGAQQVLTAPSVWVGSEQINVMQLMLDTLAVTALHRTRLHNLDLK